jgi:hypothetical protein
MAEQEMLQLGPSDLHRLHDEKYERHEHDHRDEECGHGQPDWPAPARTVMVIQPAVPHSS